MKNQVAYTIKFKVLDNEDIFVDTKEKMEQIRIKANSFISNV